jgi:hypothetical protein
MIRALSTLTLALPVFVRVFRVFRGSIFLVHGRNAPDPTSTSGSCQHFLRLPNAP